MSKSGFKISDEDLEVLKHMSCRTEASDLIEYFETQKIEQQKQDNINLLVSVLAMVASVISAIISLIALIK